MPTRSTRLSDSDLAEIRRFCARRVPARVADQYRLETEINGLAVTIVERRPPPKSPIDGPEWSRHQVARIRFVVNTRQWTLYFPDRYGRWHEYLEIDRSPNVGLLLAELDEDPTGIFWG